MSDSEQTQQQPFDTLVFEGFTGLNTDGSRPGIKDQEMFWSDGFMPVGASQLRTMPDIGAAIFTAPSGKTIEFFNWANIYNVPVALAFMSDGSVYVINQKTNSSALIMPAGTIPNPTPQNTGTAQWGNLFIIIVTQQTLSQDGYWIYDGNILYSPGGIGPTTSAPISALTSNGVGYTSAPTLTIFGGAGSGVVLTPVLSNGGVALLQVDSPGSGYNPGDYVQVAFSGGGSNTGAILTPNVANGTIASVNIVRGGNGYNFSTIPLTFAGGEGAGAAATATVTSGVITSVSVSSGGGGYNSQAAVVIPPAYNDAASATLTLMPVFLYGSAVETYQSRVWVVTTNGTTGESAITFSAPESLTDFSTASGGGLFSSADSFLRVSYIQPRQTNGFLYLIADSSVNYIGGVTTSGEPPTTSFTNQNADPEVGTPYPATVDTIGSNIVFANAWGAHVSYGGQVTKISAALDGFYNSVPNFGGFQLSAAKHIIYGKAIWVLLVPVIDQFTGSQVNKLVMWDREKKAWWTSNQSVVLTYIASQEINSVLAAYGTDGNKIYPLFGSPTGAFTKVARSKLWAKPGGYMQAKSSNRAWAVVQYNSTVDQQFTFSVDNELGQALSQNVVFPGNGQTGFYVTPPTATGQTGTLLGVTISTQAADMTIVSAAIDAVAVGYRG